MTIPVVFPPGYPAGTPGMPSGTGMPTGVSLPPAPSGSSPLDGTPLFGGWFWAGIVIIVLMLVYVPRYGYAVAGLIILYLGLTFFEPSMKTNPMAGHT